MVRPLLDGSSARPAGLDALTDAVLAVSAIAVELARSSMPLDVNPYWPDRRRSARSTSGGAPVARLEAARRDLREDR